MERKENTLQADLEELGITIYPRYQEIASTILDQKTDFKRSTDQLITYFKKKREDWHREIDDVVSKLKTDTENTELYHLNVLKKGEDKINNTLTEITED